MSRLAGRHGFVPRENAAKLGLDVGRIPGTGDVVLIDCTDGDYRFNVAGDGDFFRTMIMCAGSWPELLPEWLCAPRFPLESPGHIEDWLEELAT